MSEEKYNKVKSNWDKVLDSLSHKVQGPTFNGYVKPTYPLSLEKNTLSIAVPNKFAKDWIEKRYIPQFIEALKEATEENFDINFVVKEVEVIEKKEDEPKKIDLNNNHNNNGIPKGSNISSFNNLNPTYTFESYVIGNNNNFSTAAAQKVADSPGSVYNPLFIYGGVGLGKTHLMHAIGNHMLTKNPSVKIAYVSSEKFTNELIHSLKDQKMSDFKNKYRNIDLLLIDDIQFFGKKESTQEEFFHTFNSLYEEGKQIVLSSDRPPKDISNLEERLRSRFEMGLIADVQPPDLETRIAILKKKAEMEKINIDDEILYYIAGTFKENVRELEGAFIRVMAYSELTNMPVNLNLARTILGRETPREITLEGIQKAVSDYFKLEIDEIKGNNKTKEVTWARHIAMYISRDRTKYSLQKISAAFGRKDHTTVLHAFEKVKNLIQTEPDVHNDIQKIVQLLEE
ncbi:MAG: chromosomal replication initiator protein DnaA [Candidatus Sericytochromatia bacterium]